MWPRNLTSGRRRGSTWGRATRPLWTEEELALYVAARRRKSARLDPGGDGAPAGGQGPGDSESEGPKVGPGDSEDSDSDGGLDHIRAGGARAGSEVGGPSDPGPGPADGRAAAAAAGM